MRERKRRDGGRQGKRFVCDTSITDSQGKSKGKNAPYRGNEKSVKKNDFSVAQIKKNMI